MSVGGLPDQAESILHVENPSSTLIFISSTASAGVINSFFYLVLSNGFFTTACLRNLKTGSAKDW